MSKAFEEITESIAHLSRKQRLDLANLLLQLNDGATDDGAADEWEQEILARIRAVDRGDAEGLSFAYVMLDAERHLNS